MKTWQEYLVLAIKMIGLKRAFKSFVFSISGPLALFITTTIIPDLQKQGGINYAIAAAISFGLAMATKALENWKNVPDE